MGVAAALRRDHYDFLPCRLPQRFECWDRVLVALMPVAVAGLLAVAGGGAARGKDLGQ